jgi:hypothetical protein
MALSEQEIIRRENFNLYATLESILILQTFPVTHTKAGQRNFEDGKTVTVW